MEKNHYKLYGESSQKLVGAVETDEESINTICKYLNSAEIVKENIAYEKIDVIQHEKIKKDISKKLLN